MDDLYDRLWAAVLARPQGMHPSQAFIEAYESRNKHPAKRMWNGMEIAPQGEVKTVLLSSQNRSTIPDMNKKICHGCGEPTEEGHTYEQCVAILNRRNGLSTKTP